MLKNWSYKKAISYIPIVLAIGVALGIAGNALRSESNVVRSIILHTLTSFNIGFPLILISINARHIAAAQSQNYRIVILGLLFALIGMLASEIETIVRAFFFSEEAYQPFSAGGLYLFNAILSNILGFSIMNPLRADKDTAEEIDAIPNSHGTEDEVERLNKIPVKKGAAFHLLPVEGLVLFEAANKYAYVYDVAGDKHLCDFSLALLEQKLPERFARIHRKYIINVEQISQIQPFDKKRYMIEFNASNVPAVKSSAGYQDAIRELIKI